MITDLVSIKRYGITEKKKAELDGLTAEIADAAYEVEQYQAMVSSLTAKQGKFQASLNEAEAAREHTLDNCNLVDQLVKMIKNLVQSAQEAFRETGMANNKTEQELSPEMKRVMDKLIYSAEVINKLAALVVRKKAMNPLISDDLVSRITTAGNDANNAVALTLTALQSICTAQATNMESTAAVSLSYQQSLELYRLITGSNIAGPFEPKFQPLIMQDALDNSLQGRLHKAYDAAKANYDDMLEANQLTTQQLNDALTQLSTAQIRLKSLQAGLAAGNAAALGA